MEKKSPDKYPNHISPEERSLRSIKSVKNSQKTHSISNRPYHSYKNDTQNKNGSSGFTRKTLQLPPIVTTSSSQQCYREKHKRIDEYSSSSDRSSYITKDKQVDIDNPPAYSNLSLLLEKYKDDSTLLKLSLSKKIEEDRHKAEEAKIKHNYLDYLLSLDLHDSTSKSSNKFTHQITAVENLAESVVKYCGPLNSKALSSERDREQRSSSYVDNLNSNTMINAEGTHKVNTEYKRCQDAGIPSFNIEHSYSESASQHSDSSGTSKMSYHPHSTNGLDSQYETKNKRNRTIEESDFQYQATKKNFSYSNQNISNFSLLRKPSDPIWNSNRSISKSQSSPDVSAASSLIARKYSRHLSIPDFQYLSNSTISSSKKQNALSFPSTTGSPSRRSASPSLLSEVSSQSSSCSGRRNNDGLKINERQKIFDFEGERQLYGSHSKRNDDTDIGQEKANTRILNKKERVLLPRIEMTHDTHHNIPNPSAYLSIESQGGQSLSEHSKSKGKKREMHAITMIVETTEFPYQDHYTWKNNGNTIHKNSGSKSIYYKCSNCVEGCPVNKTVMFKEDGSYLIKYRGKHIDKCSDEKAIRISA